MKMSLFFSFFYIFSVISGCGESNATKEVDFLSSTTISFQNKSESAKLLSTSDEFTQSLSPFDFASKTQNVNANKESDYLSFAANQAQEWTNSEISEAIKVIKEAESLILKLGLKLNLPKKIEIVKSTGLEEGGASGYTRGSFIVFQSKPDLHLFIHELFHVFSRHNPEIRDQLYKTINFERTNSITYPEALLPLKISNPDAPFFEHFIKLEFAYEIPEVILITKASKPYSEGSFFEYLEIVFLELENNDGMRSVKLKDGKPIERKFTEANSFVSYVGNNTGYIIHPEEILAEHFSILITGSEAKSPDYIQAIKIILSK